MYNGLLRFNKHILNELAEGLKHLPNLDGVSKGDSLIINEQGNPAWGSTAFIPNIQDKCYFIGDQANTNNLITEFDFRFGPYFVPNKVGTNKKADYNWKRNNDRQDTDKAVCVLRLGGDAAHGSQSGSGYLSSAWVRSDSYASADFFTTVKLD